jgi:hypothetical protein
MARKALKIWRKKILIQNFEIAINIHLSSEDQRNKKNLFKKIIIFLSLLEGLFIVSPFNKVKASHFF